MGVNCKYTRVDIKTGADFQKLYFRFSVPTVNPKDQIISHDFG